ncbi:MAG: hypothetical protein WC444_05145 [Candidatus Paceibacterota bacterium]
MSTQRIVCPAIVLAVHPEDRLVDVKWADAEGGRKGVVMINDMGSYSMPNIGDSVLVLGTGVDYFCVGKIEYGYKAKLNGKQRVQGSSTPLKYKNVGPGEIIINHIRKLSWLKLANSGDFSLMNGFIEGFKYLRSIRTARVLGRTIELVANGVKIGAGTVIRNIPGKGEQPITGESGGKALEYYIQIAYNSIQSVRFHLGEIRDMTLGVVPEVSSLGGRVKALLEVTQAAVRMGFLVIDEAGNVELTSKVATTVVGGTEVKLGGVAAQEPVIKGQSYSTAEINFLSKMTSFVTALQAYITACSTEKTTAPTLLTETAASAVAFMPLIAEFLSAISEFNGKITPALSAVVKTT